MLILACGKPPENKASKNTTDSANNHAALQKSMKGFDLYAWKKMEIFSLPCCRAPTEIKRQRKFMIQQRRLKA